MQGHTINLSHLTIGYGSTVVARDLTADIEGGALTCLLGENGAGKSTLLRTIAGLQPPLGGEMTMTDGTGYCLQLAALGKRQTARTISVVLTHQPSVQNLTVRDIVAMGRMPYTGFLGHLSPVDNSIVDEALRTIRLEHFAQRNFEMLSDGERQKVMIAKALAQQTPVILLDEPTAFLDYPSKVEMMKLLRHLSEALRKTILLSTHDLDLAQRYAHRLLLLSGDGLRVWSREQLARYMAAKK